jgi:hypothetical protein
MSGNRSKCHERVFFRRYYFTSFEKFDEPRFSPRECFLNDLTGESVSDGHVVESFNMNNLCDYHDLYLLTDVVLLADVLEIFRKEKKLHFQLDAVHY